MRVLVVAAFVAALTLAGCSGSSTQSSSSSSDSSTSGTMTMPPAKTVQVSMTGMKFVNSTVNLMVGDSIVWTDNDAAPTAHTVTSDAAANQEKFDSSPNCAVGVPASQVCMTQGDTFSHPFAKAGDYTIHCKIHSAMTMTVKVMAMNMTA